MFSLKVLLLLTLLQQASLGVFGASFYKVLSKHYMEDYPFAADNNRAEDIFTDDYNDIMDYYGPAEVLERELQKSVSSYKRAKFREEQLKNLLVSLLQGLKAVSETTDTAVAEVIETALELPVTLATETTNAVTTPVPSSTETQYATVCNPLDLTALTPTGLDSLDTIPSAPLEISRTML